MGIKYDRGWGGARISLSQESVLYSQESTFRLLFSCRVNIGRCLLVWQENVLQNNIYVI